MAKVAITEQYLQNIADAIRSKTGVSSVTYYPSEMADAILTISSSGGITPAGTISITENGTYNVTSYASASVSVSGGDDFIVTLTQNQQGEWMPDCTYAELYSAYTAGKNIVATAGDYLAASINFEDGYFYYSVHEGFDDFDQSSIYDWGIISEDYILSSEGVELDEEAQYYNLSLGNAVPSDVTNGKIFYNSQGVQVGTNSGGVTPTGNINITQAGVTDVTNYATATVSAGTAGTPAATKGAVNNHAISVTPSVTNTTGWITGSTKTGTAVTVSASELVSGNKSISSNGNNIDVTNYATVSVNVSGSAPVIDSLSITPTESEQTFNSSNVDGYKPVIVSAIPDDYVGTSIPGRESLDLIVSGATVTAQAGYYSADATTSVTTMTLPTSVSASATSGYTSKATISRSTSDQYINIAPGYNSAGAYYKISAVANGSATGPSSVSGTSATVSTGTNTLTLTKTGVSTTPTVSAGYVSSATSSTATVTLTASVTTKAAATYHPSTTAQSIAASTYLTGTQTINAVTTTNLTAANIKKDVVVKIGDSSDDDCVVSITGTYEGSGGGGSGLTVATATATLSSASASISFTGLAGEPTSFAVVSAADLATGASPWKTAAVVFDGTDLHGQTIRNTSNAQVSYDGTAFSKSYSSGTLTITGSGTNFQANQYKLVYTYGGSDISTADVQVGSGATSITFTGLEEEPSYFSCIFKSNFSTSSGYQRVITVVYDGTNTYGMEMDSSAKYSDAHWSYSYSSGSLTITSSGTNAGGYFHQPGYYQLTYATEGSSGNYQSKTVYATSSQQVITADSAYDALKKVTIPAVTTTNLSASNIVSGVTIQVGDAADSDRIASVTGNVVLQNYYTGSSAPSSATGSNGDLYLQS